MAEESGKALTHKAAVIVEYGTPPKFEIRQVPRPVPGPNEVLVRLTLTSVCGSDYGMATGDLGPTKEILGHEGVGRICELGANVTAMDPSIQLGQRVGIAWTRDTCGACDYCTDIIHEGETRCAEGLFSGRKYDGTFAEYAIVPARYVIHIPSQYDDVPDEEVAPVLCGGVTAYKALKCCEVTPGQYIAVSGVGGVGALAVSYAKAMGYRVIGVDMGEEKGKECLGQGAEHYVDISKVKDAGEEVKRLSGGRGAQAVLVAAGAMAAYQAAFNMLGPFGTLMCVGIPPPDKLASFHPIWFISYGWRILGSSVGTRRDILEALEFVKRRVVVPKIKFAVLEDMNDIMAEIDQRKAQGKYVIRFPQ